MSAAQLDAVIKDVQACFGAWTAETTLDQMRKDWDEVFAKHPSNVGAKCENVDAGGVPAVRITAPGAASDRAILYLHGGGYVFGSPRSHKDLGEFLSKAAKAQVFLLDYRLAPEHPYPAAVDDATAAYRWLLKSGFKPERIAVSGDSAGGGLCAATLLSIKNHKLPMPACAVPLSPWADLECTSETFTTKAADDPMVQREMTHNLAAMYAPGNLKDPLVSPLNGDFKGLPPLLIQVGERETLLGDSQRMAEIAKKAGVPVTLEIEPGQIHVFQIFSSRLDEGVAAIDRMGRFILSHTGG
ncbi:MAG: putative lipase esterase protein [Panacagrimonas sp.]|jgi:acetyl esterase/lipase|nr:alpha/beta hydrolase [Panacagrimonas sp.]MCC2658413.1 putative lipase esterase protein [Panacagrimonas sp.]